jgi:FixJ family two-component response regulator
MSHSPRGHVHVVDDNADIRLHLTNLLRQMGYSVSPFDSADAFLQQPTDIFPSVLVLDVRMPGMSGVELQEKMKSLGRQTPIIFMSGESQSTEIIRAMKGEPIEFLWKPFQIEALIDAIDRGLLVDAQMRSDGHRHEGVRRKVAGLSAREREVFALMLHGHSNKGISDKLDILPDTVKKHRARVLEKMQALQLPDLMAMCQGLDVPSLFK